MRMNIRDYAREGWDRLRLGWNLRGIEHRNPILVYQMGKVGSSTVVQVLESLRLPSPVLHLHTLQRHNLAQAISRQRGSVRPRLHEHLLVSGLLIPRLPFPCRVITLTREPIARVISFVFEDRWKKIPDALRRDGTIDVARARHVIEEMLRADNGHADPTYWFEEELQAVFGMDVFSRPFDRERGYMQLERDEISLLVLRLEDLDRVLAPALAHFLDVPAEKIRPSSANVGARKGYGATLKEVKATLQLPDELLDRIYGTRYAQHFYAEEAALLRSKWARREEAMAGK
jgi:hypothetical protein